MEYGRTMVQILLLNTLPVPTLCDDDVSSLASLNVLYANLYHWFKTKPSLFNLPGYTSEIAVKLEKRCTKTLKKEERERRRPGQSTIDVDLSDCRPLCHMPFMTTDSLDDTAVPCSPEIPYPRYCSTPKVTPADHPLLPPHPPSNDPVSPLTHRDVIIPHTSSNMTRTSPPSTRYNPEHPPPSYPLTPESMKETAASNNMGLPKSSSVGYSSLVPLSLPPGRIPTLQPLTPTNHDSTLFYPENDQMTPPPTSKTLYDTVLPEDPIPTVIAPPKPLEPLPVLNPYLQQQYHNMSFMFSSPYHVRAGVPSHWFIPPYQWPSSMFPDPFFNSQIHTSSRTQTAMATGRLLPAAMTNNKAPSLVHPDNLADRPSPPTDIPVQGNFPHVSPNRGV